MSMTMMMDLVRPAGTTRAGRPRPPVSIATRSWQIGAIAWSAVTVLVVALLWTARVADQASARAAAQDDSITHPLLNSATAVYRADLAFANTVFGPQAARGVLEARLSEELTGVESSLDSIADPTGFGDQLDLAVEQWETARGEIATSLAASDDATRVEHAQNVFDALAAMSSHLEDAATASRASTVEELERADAIRDRMQWVAILIAAAGLLAAGLLLRRFTRGLTAPLTTLRAGAADVADGNEVGAIVPSGPIELVDLAVSFNTMADRLRERGAMLTHREFHDPLTGLGNRASLELHLDTALLGLRRDGGRRVAMVVLDLDDFKDVNDALGYAIGDRVLRLVAERIDDMLRPSDTVFRLAADEFGVLVHGPTGCGIIDAQRLVDAIVAPIEIDGHEIRLDVSVGIAFGATGEETVDGLLRDADLALHAAKGRAGTAIECFDGSLLDAATRRVRLGNELRVAIEAGQLEVHYQPVLNLKRGNVVGAESLVRWRHPTRGLLPPSEFIDLAEHTGLIVPLGAAVLDIALRDAAGWCRRHPGSDRFNIAVNISARQIATPSFVDDVLAAIERAGVAPRDLCLELTETVLMDRSDDLDAKLAALRSRGVVIALDDYGTGHSSLDLIHALHVDMIKIDRSFVSGIDASDRLRTLVDSVITIARTYDTLVVAEGVETEQESASVRELGVSMVQGYLFGRPVPADEFERRWMHRPTVEVVSDDELIELADAAVPARVGADGQRDGMSMGTPSQTFLPWN